MDEMINYVISILNVKLYIIRVLFIDKLLMIIDPLSSIEESL